MLGKRKQRGYSQPARPRKKTKVVKKTYTRSNGYDRVGVGLYGRFNVPKAPRRAEKKFTDLYLNSIADANSNGLLLVPSLFYIPRGDGPSQRIGSKVFAEKVTFRYKLYPGGINSPVSSTPGAPLIRVMVVQDMQANGTVPIPSDILQLAANQIDNEDPDEVPTNIDLEQSLAYMNISNSKRFRILHDKMHVFQHAIGAYATNAEPSVEKVIYRYIPKTVDKTKNLKFDVEYDNLNTNGWITGLKSANIFVLLFSDNTFQNHPVSFKWYSRVRYTDS